MNASGWRTIGNEKAVAALRRALDGDRLSHAYLVTGPRHVGKMSLAIDLAAALNCDGSARPCGECKGCDRTRRSIHAGVHVVGLEDGPEGRSRTLIGIDQVRAVQRETALAPFEGRFRVVIFDAAERLSDEAANSLLKTLEEPPPQVVLLLLTSKPEALLPTVVSRCQLVELRPVAGGAIAAALVDRLGMAADEADRIARLAGGRPGWAIRAAENPELLTQTDEKLDILEEVVLGGMADRFAHAAKLGSAADRNREAGRSELDVWVGWWRDVMLVKEGLPHLAANASRMESLSSVADSLTRSQVAGAISAIRETKSLIERNVNPRLSLEVMMLDLPRVRQP